MQLIHYVYKTKIRWWCTNLYISWGIFVCTPNKFTARHKILDGLKIKEANTTPCNQNKEEANTIEGHIQSYDFVVHIVSNNNI